MSPHIYKRTQGLASAQSTVTLTSSVEQAGRQAACPGEEVTFTCTVTEAAGLQWRINQSEPIRFVVSGIPENIGTNQTDPSGHFTAGLISSMQGMTGNFGSFTSELTVTVSERLNGTVVQCDDAQSISMNTTLNIAGIIHVLASCPVFQLVLHESWKTGYEYSIFPY